MAFLVAKTIKGSTLLESLVAMVIIMTIVAISSMTFANVLKSDSHRSKLSAQILMDQALNKTITQSVYPDSDLTNKNIRVHKTITPYPGHERLFTLKMMAYTNQNEVIGEKTILFYKND